MNTEHPIGRDTWVASHLDTAVSRPATCPSCQGRAIDTLAKVITAETRWRCRGCDHAWTGAGTAAARYPARYPAR
jgi:ribosomal protein L37AE/L43A